jgi:hypothetical protein
MDRRCKSSTKVVVKYVAGQVVGSLVSFDMLVGVLVVGLVVGVCSLVGSRLTSWHFVLGKVAALGHWHDMLYHYQIIYIPRYTSIQYLDKETTLVEKVACKI